MKKTTFPLIFIVLISLCSMPTLFQEGEVLQSGVSIIDLGSPDVFLKIEAVPNEIKSGRTVLLVFEMRNKNNFDLRDIEVLAYDNCVFQGTTKEEIDILKANSTKTWTWKWDSEELEMDRDCLVKFRTTYFARNSIFQDITVLSESEYQLREIDGTLHNIPIQSSFPNSPLQINIRFSDPQPFIDNEEYNMFLDFLNVGEGIVELEKDSIGIYIPSNINDITCNNFGSSSMGCCEFGLFCMMVPSFGDCSYITGSSWHSHQVCNPEFLCVTRERYKQITGKDFEQDFISLNKDINFINKKGAPATCTFTTSSVDILEIETLRIDAEYVYKIDNSLTIKVKR